ncbi:MAG: hypothetical protein AB7F89_20135 [Pirellulaceae bacterium]
MLAILMSGIMWWGIAALAGGHPLLAKGFVKSPTPAAQSTQTFEGTVVLVAPDSVTLALAGRWTTFLVPPSTVIRVNSAEAPLDAVTPGQFASVIGHPHGHDLVAKLIDARRQY